MKCLSFSNLDVISNIRTFQLEKGKHKNDTLNKQIVVM